MQLMSSEVGSSSRAIEGRRDKRAGGILWVLTPSRLLVRSYRRECSLGSCDGRELAVGSCSFSPW